MAATARHQRWSQAWLRTLRALDLLATKPTVGAGSRIRRMEVALGQVTAEVQDRDHGLCQVTIHFTPLSDEIWGKVLELFQQQLAAAPVIEPRIAFPENDPIFHDLCTLLLPANHRALHASCSCCPTTTSVQNCPALQTVYRQLGAMLDEEPVLLLRLRSREWQQVVQTLQKRRGSEYGAPAASPGTAPRLVAQAEHTTGREAAVDADALANQLSNFWGSRKQMESVQHHIGSPTVDLAILRRLGPLPEQLADPIVDQQLAMLYRAISREAEALAYDLEIGNDTPGATLQSGGETYRADPAQQMR